jgi:LysM repeat protein
LIAKAVGATLAGVIGTSAEAPTRRLRRQTLLRVLAAGGAVVLAACNTESSRHTARSTRSKTVASSTTVTSTTTTTAPPIRYRVKRGDTLTAVAKYFGVSMAVIALTNHLANGDRLTVGQILEIPPAPPAQLVVAPADAPVGEAFKFNLTAAKAGESVTFEVDAPGGAKFTGPPHTASREGSVTATYRTTLANSPGTYTVVATGDHGTSVRATFRVEPGGPNTQPP